MDIVFIHGNYPAQFRHLAAGLGQSGAHRVIFLTAREDANTQPIPGVEIRQFTLHRQASEHTHHYLKATEDAVLKGQAVLRALIELAAEGIHPRVVISHAGNGLGLFIKDYLPGALHIGFFEWYFQPSSAEYLLPEADINERLQIKMRNLPILEELNNCDVGVVPTNWQKSQFPKEFWTKLKIIFDGIDTAFFQPDHSIDDRDISLTGEAYDGELRITKDNLVLSYATRGMETLRGFPEFMRAASKALEKIPTLSVVIAGRDRRAYSYDAPTHEGSWKAKLLEELGNFPGRERMHFMGLMPYVQYRSLLQRSNLHCYFTRPYVTSWSLFEAAASGARLCLSEGPATDGIIEDRGQAIWVNLDQPRQLENTVVNALRKSNELKRSSLIPGFELSACLREWQSLINSQLQAMKN